MNELQNKADELIANLNDTLKILSEIRMLELTGEFTPEQIKNANIRSKMTGGLIENARNSLIAARRIRSLL